MGQVHSSSRKVLLFGCREYNLQLDSHDQHVTVALSYRELFFQVFIPSELLWTRKQNNQAVFDLSLKISINTVNKMRHLMLLSQGPPGIQL